MASTHGVVYTSYPRVAVPADEPDEAVVAPGSGLRDFQTFFIGINELWAYHAPILVQELAFPTDRYLTSGDGQTSHWYRFPTPWTLDETWSNKIELWVVRRRPTHAGTWTIDVDLNGAGASTYAIPSETTTPGHLALLATLTLDDGAAYQEMEVGLNTMSGGPTSTTDFIYALVVIPARSAITELPEVSSPGTPHERGLIFLPTDELGQYAAASVHMLRHARDILQDVYDRRHSVIVCQGIDQVLDQSGMVMYAEPEVPPGVTSATFYVRLKMTNKLAGSEVQITLDDETWSPTTTTSLAWVTHTFTITAPDGEGRGVPFSVRAILFSTEVVTIDAICGWWDPIT